MHISHRIKKKIKEIEALRGDMMNLPDEAMPERTAEFRQEYAQTGNLDALLVRAFALAREAARRVLGLEPYPEQMMAGVVLHEGAVAELATGQGKTLAAVLPAYLNAIAGKGVHIVTVNDYLAKRDAEWMGPVYNLLGLSVGVVLNEMKTPERQAAYASDVTYVTNSELGFDYLRDNMVQNAGERVLRGLHYAVIDEVDSILIDEARTPLIISGAGTESSMLYQACDVLAGQMIRGNDIEEKSKMDLMYDAPDDDSGDYLVDEKHKNVQLTKSGIARAEAFFGIKNLAAPEYTAIQRGVILALRANNLMKRDHDYIVRDGAVEIVDEFTGRVLEGRRYSAGLHQAIEAKEHVEIKDENATHATISFQNFFNKFLKKSGMTGTAYTEKGEFRDIYSMKVIPIPTHQPVIREDLPDRVYVSAAEKYDAAVREIFSVHQTGQPILVGTTSIHESERVSEMLTARGVEHRVLNAKQDKEEAETIALAGQKNAVTIATNMAGRGTDILLGEGAREAGGLYVIGTSKNDARRIDNQLRGRSGRQGDPGKSVFFVSLEDDLMRLYAPPRLTQAARKSAESDGLVTSRGVRRLVETAQKKLEGQHYSARKQLVDFDAVNNQQREAFYKDRNRIIDHEISISEFNALVKAYASRMIQNGQSEGFTKASIGVEHDDPMVLAIDITSQELVSKYGQDSEQARMEALLLSTMDREWAKHLEAMDALKDAVALVTYGHKTPVVEYRRAGFELYKAMMETIQEEFARRVFTCA